MAKKRKLSVEGRLFLMQAAGILFTFLPLFVVVFIQREQYFVSRAAGWSLTAGGGVAAVVVVCGILGKGKKFFGSGFAVSGIVFVLAILLEPIILNLQLLTGMLFLGEAINAIFFAPKARKLKRQVLAKANARAFKEECNG